MKSYYTVVYDNSAPGFPEVFYPQTRYVFDDDDPEVLSCALSAQHRLLGVENTVSKTRDRAILLDFSNTDGGNYEVARSSSLSADWIVTGTRLSHMEATPSDTDIKSQGDEPWMLVIEGIEMLATVDLPTKRLPAVSSSKPTRHHGGGTQILGKEESDVSGEDYKELIRDFNIRMDVLKHLLQNSEHTQRPLSVSEAEKDACHIQPSENEVSHGSG
ncbi:hypothetical protein CMQ_4958 [Grosmannia clavigera kw1407]|uniref:Uncharacterized protein n=1 Tax=Grosmannia clavigera (strain kw1407 / UAMH 11150) TaxID=655863 RepID=F0XJX6_GROCL|nr:uncharacterized protein CMQ_4958 [Grosmannia clavigera kw1407]EFX01887.1 hypothetical protein CMQ_4958 [Grosmannia clavigera kw1407]